MSSTSTLTAPSRHEERAATPPGRLEPWFAALDLTAGGSTAPAATRRWVDACLAEAEVAPEHRATLRRVGTELAREATLRALPGEQVRVELDLVGPIARMSARGPSATQRLGARAVEALQSAYEWGIERVSGGSRLVWCHLELA
ncbi:MAG TPA: hypothetical protein VGC67_04185 [Cellulomonas sp.]